MKLFIGCSSSNDIPIEYFEDCKTFLNELMKENELVFGACTTGLMGLAYNIALNANREVTGICPEVYKENLKELSCNTKILTKTVSERTSSVISASDTLIFLPGGIGTIYELFTAIESKRCHEFDKPIVIYNSHGYFDKLLEFMQKLYDEHFSNLKDKRNYFVSNSLSSILYYIENYQKIKEIETNFGISYTSDKLAIEDFIKEDKIKKENVLKKML